MGVGRGVKRMRPAGDGGQGGVVFREWRRCSTKPETPAELSSTQTRSQGPVAWDRLPRKAMRKTGKQEKSTCSTEVAALGPLCLTLISPCSVSR